MDRSTPGLPVLHHLPELAQTHVHWVGDAIQPSHPLSPTSPPALSLFQHQGLSQWSCLITSGDQSIGASASVLPMNIQGWFPLGLTGLISLHSKGLTRVFSCTNVWKHQFFGTQPSLSSNSHICTWLLRKPWLWLWVPLLAKWYLYFFNTLSRFVRAFLPRSKHLLISWMQSPSAVILEPKKIVCHCFYCFSIYLPWSDGTRCHELYVLNVEF